MRVITGIAKGRKLKTPQGMNVRPTADSVKEAVFNIIRDDIMGRRVLDLFAGSGQLGIEALSRGAREAVFVDVSKNINPFSLAKASPSSYETCLLSSKSFLFPINITVIVFELLFLTSSSHFVT